MQGKQGLSETDKKILGALLTALIAIILALIAIALTINLSNNLFGQPNQPSNTPSSTPTPVATITADIVATPTPVVPGGGDVLIIKGTVTNDSPNTAYDVGLNVTAQASILMLGYPNVIDMIVPASSGEYAMGNDYELSTLAPNQSVAIDIKIIPYYQSQSPQLENVNVAAIWSNPP